MRIVIFSHGHPTFSKGGGEIAAYNLFRALSGLAGHQAWFFARVDARFLNSDSRLARAGENEFLMAGAADIENLASPVAYWQGDDLADVLRDIDPDVVHLHHYVHLGVELIRTIRTIVPRARSVLTLHEYIAICVNNGQMIKTSGRLCYQASPRECSQCFPNKTPEDFFLRERYIKSFFALVDHFISPSEFLKKRYAAWGLDANRITVIENGLHAGDQIPPRALVADERRGRFAYLGQINPFKGLDLILEAFSRLPKKVRQRVSLDVFGSGLESQPAEFRAKVEGLMASLKDVVRFHGSYEQEELPDIMRATDWVLMGSIWWENSPVVIQEAFKFGRPVLCPDIGGMAEKVLVGTGGVHYRARDPIALAAAIESCSSDTERYQALIETLPAFNSTESCAADHLEMYASLGSDKTQAPLAVSAHA